MSGAPYSRRRAERRLVQIVATVDCGPWVVLVLLCAGNLSVTQSVVHIREQHRNADPAKPSIWTADNLFDVASLVGDALREVQERNGAHLVQDP